MPTARRVTIPDRTVWLPSSTEEIERAARAGALEETPSFDAKAALPPPRKNAGLAVDVAAMSTEGGVLLYGVAEDEHERPTVPSPIALAAATDRIAQIVETSIAEVPQIVPHIFECPDDPSRGYIALVVPQSPRAPHQVIVGGDHRFYGRGPKGNRRLSEGEVARLYERRQRWDVDRREVLAQVIANAPAPDRGGAASIHGLVRPVVPQPGLAERALATFGSEPSQQLKALINAVWQTKLHGKHSPSLERATSWTRRSADEWRFSNVAEHQMLSAPLHGSVVDMRFVADGMVKLWCDRATSVVPGSDDDQQYILEVVIAGSVEAMCALASTLYDAVGYSGSVDVGVAVTGLAGATSVLAQDMRFWNLSPQRYGADTYSATDRVVVSELSSPSKLGYGLLRPLFDASTGVAGYNPFEQE